ncbi:MAG: hypothetical protein GY718_00775, partial [Lentisphaerae bacterium]|nr:hypothetical protein [Lentisphaerota bacterium]
ISYQTIQDDRFKNCILAAQKKDPLFPQADENAHPVFPQRVGKQVTDLEQHDKHSNKTYLNNQNGLWRSNYTTNDKRIVITSSPVEALSYHESKGSSGTRYIAMTDNMSEQQKALLKTEITKVPEIEVATSKEKDTELIKSLLGVKENEKESVQTALQKSISEALKDKPTTAVFLERMTAANIKVQPNLATTGRMSGISFEHEEMKFKGSQLGREYSWAGLQKKGLNYESNRDYDVLKRA